MHLLLELANIKITQKKHFSKKTKNSRKKLNTQNREEKYS